MFLTGSPLSAGVHYLLLERTATGITVRQRSGADTSIRVTLPPDWELSERIQARAFTRGGQAVEAVPATLDKNRAAFSYSKVGGTAPVDGYEISRPGQDPSPPVSR